LKTIIRLLFFIPCIAFAQNNSDTLRWDRELVEHNDSFHNDSFDFSIHCRYRQEYILFSGNTDADSINRVLIEMLVNKNISDRNQVKKELETYGDSFTKSWKQNLPADMYSLAMSFEDQTSFQVAFQNPKYTTVIYNNYGYMGGAHGLSIQRYLSFQRPGGKLLENWQDLFTDTTAVLKLAERIFKKEKNIQKFRSRSHMWFWGGDFYLSSNFGLTDEGIRFVYTEYEIAPYAYGSTELLLPYAEIKDYLKVKYLDTL
jgi:hypothetical protein